jgi:mRNA-degrading endonuclease RelE of RelBE toxin-antitoxin system
MVASAQKALEALPERYAAAILEFVLGPLSENPQRVGGRLRGDRVGQHSAHVGPYRVIYRIEEQDRVVRVLRVAHRADAYRS